MRALRIDLSLEALPTDRAPTVIGTDLATQMIRYSGNIPGNQITTLPLQNSAKTLIFINESSLPILIIVRDALAVGIQESTVLAGSEAIIPVAKEGSSIDFVNSDPSLAKVTIFIF